MGSIPDRGAMGLGQYNSLGEYCGRHTASSVFLILIGLVMKDCENHICHKSNQYDYQNGDNSSLLTEWPWVSVSKGKRCCFFQWYKDR